MPSARQLAFLALRAIQRGAFADVALDRILQPGTLSESDRRLCTELVYGTVRRQRTLDALIDQLATKSAQQQPPDLRLILHLGFYQLRYLNHIPPSAAVDTTVELAKQNGLKGLAGVVNGLLRRYVRSSGKSEDRVENAIAPQASPASSRDATENAAKDPAANAAEDASKDATDAANDAAEDAAKDAAEDPQVIQAADPLQLPQSDIERLGILHSYPDWIVAVWLEQFGLEVTEQLCQWFNRSPHIDLRVNPLRTSIEEVEAAMQSAGVTVQRVPPLPQALRLMQSAGNIQHLPGFAEGWWTVQDCSAQLVSYLVEPLPGETVIDACAAPGGKTTHLAELMQDQGLILACDRQASRLKKLQENATRLQLHSIQIQAEDSRDRPQFQAMGDRVLLDAPCSGLGTLHRHADARWRQTPTSVQELATLQTELLHETATWVKPGGTLVYATCTLHPQENEQIIETFLTTHPHWQINPPTPPHPAAPFVTPQGWLKVIPSQQNMDGFFMVRLRRGSGE
ncbi:MAG: 16S rRNA (cytosine(967)-C(5))-methyltransferase [Oculatellaceae cyanobacterium Prado106]|jgi:16S rRNA (cytosine967-C5)-methyltransferase|nr:16S rRNA (cytosine(967)-C(5))-methyltransferase [Oculatellaceae cyanobacterium Prado106]